MSLNDSLKKAVPGGDPVEVLDDSGKVIGFCGIEKPWKLGDPPRNPDENFFKCLIKATEQEEA